MKKITILIHCKDQAGIIAAVTNFIGSKNGNIVYIDQHVDQEQQVFFMRLEGEFSLNSYNNSEFKRQFQKELADNFGMSWELYTAVYKPRMALFVSKYDHCLYDILGRFKSGELNLDIPLIISNHLDLKPIANSFGVPFFHIPVTKDTKLAVQAKHLSLLSEHKIDFIVLARYMQIIPEGLINEYTHKIINIHHSFLPAFVGAKPYHSAYKRGVKIIGATSHYVTAELDAGPIIEQDVTRVSHSHSINDLLSKGRDLEKIVLSTGIKLHLDHKVMVYNNKTVIFS
jgi:formyltetrahydrofolate deformylase|tara:strand:+ start:12330 stop:13184 length:855 start_codon:yes stop_codon:yes gene_type:complete